MCLRQYTQKCTLLCPNCTRPLNWSTMNKSSVGSGRWSSR